MKFVRIIQQCQSRENGKRKSCFHAVEFGFRKDVTGLQTGKPTKHDIDLFSIRS